MDAVKRRVFFGFDAVAPWPDPLPAGRVLRPQDRHVTLAFMGMVEVDSLLKLMPYCPKPPPMGAVGAYTECLFLPPKKPRGVAWKLDWWTQKDALYEYQRALTEWLIDCDYAPHSTKRGWLPHTTIARGDYSDTQWRQDFRPLPVITTHLHLFESLGHSQYDPLWSLPLQRPFTRTANLEWQVTGKTLADVYLGAHAALCFDDTRLMPFKNQAIPHTPDEFYGWLDGTLSQCEPDSPLRGRQLGELLPPEMNESGYTWQFHLV